MKQKENIQHRLWVFNIGKVHEIFDVVTIFLSLFLLGSHTYFMVMLLRENSMTQCEMQSTGTILLYPRGRPNVQLQIQTIWNQRCQKWIEEFWKNETNYYCNRFSNENIAYASRDLTQSNICNVYLNERNNVYLCALVIWVKFLILCVEPVFCFIIHFNTRNFQLILMQILHK